MPPARDPGVVPRTASELTRAERGPILAAMTTNQITVEQVAHHRNGISGAPFIVILFRADTDRDRNVPFVATLFDEVGQCAVLRRDHAIEDVAFGAGNSWRGEHYEPQLRVAITEWEARCEAIPCDEHYAENYLAAGDLRRPQVAGRADG